MSTDIDPVDLVDPIAAAVQACPAVAGLHGGRFGQATTYLPGRRVAGVAVFPGEIVIGVVGRYPASVSEIATQVRAAVSAVAPDVPVTVQVEDLLLPGEDRADPAPDPPPAPTASGRPVDAPPSANPAAPQPVPPVPAAAPRAEGTTPIPTHPPVATTPLARPLEKERFS